MNKKRINLLIIVIIIIFLIMILRVLFLSVIKKEYYSKLYEIKTSKIIYGQNKERGRILDVNNNVLVDNIKIKRITYKKGNYDEKRIAKELSKLIHIEDDVNNEVLFDYYVLNNGSKLINDEELILFRERKITKEELNDIKYSRIDIDIINNQSTDEKEEAYIYYLMNKGYSYDIKIIKDKNVTDIEYANICELNIDGIICDYTWERIYPYKDTLRSILGSVSSRSVGIPTDLKDYYDDAEYIITDRVGISYLEQQYDKHLRGTKDEYLLNHDNSLTLIKEGTKGKDLVLSIDINAQLELDNIVKEEIINAKKARNSKYFNSMYALIGSPIDGRVIAISAWKYIDGDFIEISNTSIISSFTLGSVVKGASISLGYKYNLIDIGTKMKDSCIKLNNVPEKCSYKYLGSINDLSAITNSSNYFQFMIAIKLTGNKYSRGMNLNSTKEHFESYRNMFKSFGLGIKTNIDLPNESLGVTGKTISDDLLLNLSIGQYDTYTPVMLLNYINTIANKGSRVALKLNNDLDTKIINQVELDKKYFDRIHESFKSVSTSGTGRGYFSNNIDYSSKTGTSESFINGEKTITTAFASYFPSDNPKYSVVLISPNIGYSDNSDNYRYPINRRISNKISKKVFEYLK